VGDERIGHPVGTEPGFAAPFGSQSVDALDRLDGENEKRREVDDLAVFATMSGGIPEIQLLPKGDARGSVPVHLEALAVEQPKARSIQILR
jgi:hypothetical protein